MKHLSSSNCSLVVATYNWPQALRLCLKSIAGQSVLPKEVIVADDGSRKDTRYLIEEIEKDFPVPLVHIWQPDEGFQLAKVRNKAFASARHDYIIQVDGDLVLHPHFVEDHIHIAKHGYFVSGSRTILSEEVTKKILMNGDLTRLNVFSGKASHFFNSVRIGVVRRFLARRYKVSGPNRYYVKGCNMAFWRKDVVKVNGYNETFTGWGREDSEIAIRLINAGIRKQFIKTGGICYHLYHKEASKDLEQRNVDMMNEAVTNKTIRAQKGLDQYLKSDVKQHA